MKSLAKRKAAEDASQREKVSFFQRLKRITAKKEEVERRSAYRPRGYVARKFGTALFWIAFAFMFLVVLFSALTPNDRAATAQPVIPEIKLNPATTTTAVQYAENFAKEYFTWAADEAGLKDRKTRLAPYLAKGLDEQAGLQVNGLKTTSTYLKSEIKNIEEKGENKAFVTLKVYYKVGVPKEVKATDPTTKAETVTTEYVPTEVSKFFVVPVGYQQNYGIYDLPRFTFINPQTTLETEDPTKGLQDVESAESKQNVRNFLDTFFGSYAADPRDKLAYLLEDKEHPSGLNQTLKFVSVQSAQIFQGASLQEFIVFSSVIFEDPQTKDQFNTNYKLNVIQKDGRYVVNKIDEQ